MYGPLGRDDYATVEVNLGSDDGAPFEIHAIPDSHPVPAVDTESDDPNDDDDPIGDAKRLWERHGFAALGAVAQTLRASGFAIEPHQFDTDEREEEEDLHNVFFAQPGIDGGGPIQLYTIRDADRREAILIINRGGCG
jgi:hypothetical protein